MGCFETVLDLLNSRESVEAEGEEKDEKRQKRDGVESWLEIGKHAFNGLYLAGESATFVSLLLFWLPLSSPLLPHISRGGGGWGRLMQVGANERIARPHRLLASKMGSKMSHRSQQVLDLLTSLLCYFVSPAAMVTSAISLCDYLRERR